MRMFYLTLEAPREGTASFTHVHEIISGLQQYDWSLKLFKPFYTNHKKSPSLIIRFFVFFWMQLCLWLQRPQGTIIYMRSHPIAFPTSLIAFIFKIPLFLEVNGPYQDVFITYPALKPFRQILIAMQKIQYRHATALFTVTRELASWLEKESNGRPVFTISNAANTSLFKPDVPRDLTLPEHYVIFFGSFNAWHGIPCMIEAVKSPLWPEHVKLVLVGEGNMKEEVESAARKNDKIIVTGRKPYRDMPACIAHAIAGLVPISNTENRANTGLFPLKLFETLACGVPAIVTDYCGQADLIRHHNCGIVIPAGEAEEIARSVATLSENPVLSREMGIRGMQAVKDKHDWQMRAQSIAEIIKRFVKA